jgi:hypothetical protein
MKIKTQCSKCGADRYADPPVPSPYVCKRCLAGAKPKTPKPTPSASPPSGDPFMRDDRKNPDGSLKRVEQSRKWIPNTRGWLRRSR